MLQLCRLISAALGRRTGSSDTFLKGGHLRTISLKFGPNSPSSFREDFLKHFSHRVLYVKTMLVHVTRLGLRAWSSVTILKGDHLRTMPLNFGPNRPSSFREEDF